MEALLLLEFMKLHLALMFWQRIILLKMFRYDLGPKTKALILYDQTYQLTRYY